MLDDTSLQLKKLKHMMLHTERCNYEYALTPYDLWRNIMTEIEKLEKEET